MKNHIAIFVPDLSGGGAERSMVNLSGGLADLGLQVDLVLAKARGPFLSKVPSGVRVVDLKASHTMLSLPSLRRYLKSEQPEALLAALNQANVVAAWSKRFGRHNARVAVSIRNTLSKEASEGSSLNSKIMPAFAKRYFPWADEIISVSDGAADDFARMAGMDRSRVRTIYNPVVTPQLLKEALVPIDHPWFAPEQPPVVLAVGRLNVQKGYPTLLRAFAKVREKRKVRLVILGEGELQEELTVLAGQLGISEDFALPGFASNPFAYMSRASVFVLSSLYEGLPGALIQALACGAPVVSTDCPSGPQEVLQGGKYGALITVGDVDAMAREIEAVLIRRDSGEDVRPPDESWAPFELLTATRQYASVLLGRDVPVQELSPA